MTQVSSVSAPRTTQTTSGSDAPALSTVVGQGGVIQRGMTGESVKDLQRLLNARGARLDVDGDFGPRTQEAVRAFQQRAGVSVDGAVGSQTLRSLQGPPPAIRDGVERRPTGQTTPRAPTQTDLQAPPPGTIRAGQLAGNNPVAPREPRAPAGAATLAPPSASERARYDHYAAIIRANGGQVNPNGQPTVLGLRGLSRDGNTHATTSARQYDDTFVVLTADGRAREFRGATHPGQNSSTASPDVTGDGRGDVGMIRAGNYSVVANGPHAGAASYHVRTTAGSGSLPGFRDTDHDGRFSSSEQAASERRGDRLTEVLFHQGGSSAPSSIGCQTLSPQEYSRFMAAVGGSRGSFNYTLVDANR